MDLATPCSDCLNEVHLTCDFDVFEKFFRWHAQVGLNHVYDIKNSSLFPCSYFDYTSRLSNKVRLVGSFDAFDQKFHSALVQTL